MLHKKKSRRWPKILLAVIAVMLLVGGVFAAYAYYQTKQTANKIYKASDENASAVVKQKKPLSILLLSLIHI